ncbi:AraC family transcriptional regulator [Paraburkholderia fynbosensis]|uniref:IS5 family transposase IS4811 n=1 Tax=Paraburkholderia fynbosensis TaxID=1200993 RepID=A0A6J5H414_9BURK|nr:AraC family transcriptional regulator [Paraburkholderia fynbosensis]CAB3808605.1 IS5 family transposase IS4811 [Paraburkholderia fynbosensis]
MDALSDVLSMLRVSSVLSSRFEGSGAWAFRFAAYQGIKFGGVLAGRSHLWIEGSKAPLTLEPGDFYMLTDGQPFYSASDPRRAPLDGPATYRRIRGADGVVRYRGEGEGNCDEGGGRRDSERVIIASGRFTFENDVTGKLLSHLPPLIHLRAAELGSQALSRLLDLLGWETTGLHAGADIARSSLAALVLVHVLRTYLASTPQPEGWLGALADPKIGSALSMMHAQPGERWTVESLAYAVGMSRTAFAARFRRQVGSAPVEYLAQWRMTIACSALKHSEASLTDIALRIGYLSDTAFSIAFKRSTGQSPGRFRALSRET